MMLERGTLGRSNLDKVATIDLKGMDPRLKNAQFVVACDVDNPCAEKKGPQLFTVHKKGQP